MPKKIRILSLSTLVFAVLLACDSFAVVVIPLDSDTSAISGWYGSQSFSGSGYGCTFDGEVDYAVYAPGTYGGSLTFSGDHYVYAYQLFNDNISNVVIDTFQMGKLAAVPVASAISDHFYSVPGGIASGPQYIMSENVLYLFMAQSVGAGQYSTVLLFSSPSMPTWGAGVVSGGVTGGVVVDNLPTPIPEPATVMILGGGVLMMNVTRKRKK